MLRNYSCQHPVQPEHTYVCDSTHMQSIALELCWANNKVRQSGLYSADLSHVYTECIGLNTAGA